MLSALCFFFFPPTALQMVSMLVPGYICKKKTQKIWNLHVANYGQTNSFTRQWTFLHACFHKRLRRRGVQAIPLFCCIWMVKRLAQTYFDQKNVNTVVKLSLNKQNQTKKGTPIAVLWALWQTSSLSQVVSKRRLTLNKWQLPKQYFYPI